ncbi:hydroxymethylglutaryl-CoA synthase [Streptomyces qinzhouensis]|uniref:Hydroxymethylglutaryl-CoA synthase n=1 Tax=Streptomyces qinzhouensis TaxID=2599401 RepID=A0A5B8IP27_9ACTN|nr:hydroxymethylglutaryl-CoA synthase [Streptomyces qinzhouensis]QDY80398.1 hydroxymethylglutaryl-CoA synthase [Streptomyces qinzhouensis]
MPTDPTEVTAGIHDLSFATTSLCLTHEELARHTGAPVAKYHHGIGQTSMSIPTEDEDIVTLAADAAAPIVERHGSDRIRTILFATETGIDQSKAAGVYVHSLLGLSPHIRVVELKQACYGATAALQLACALVRTDPAQEVLVLASDIARYDLDSPGEATQGAAAAAMLITAAPGLLELGTPSGLFTRDIMDFWRPNYRTTALVDGKASLDAYLDAVDGAWLDYRARGGLPFEKLRTVCYHQPFTRIAHKAHRRLERAEGLTSTVQAIDEAIAPTTTYNQVIGNSYTASMYLALAALLDSDADLGGDDIGLFSYGSGSVAEFFTGRVGPAYRAHLRADAHRAQIARREPISYAAYRDLHTRALPVDGTPHEVGRRTLGRYRLAGIRDHQRQYRATRP